MIVSPETPHQATKPAGWSEPGTHYLPSIGRMALVVLPRRLRSENPVPDWSAGDYVMFVLAAFQTGLVGGWKVVAAVTTLAGGSVAAHAVAIREFTLPWAVLALLVIFATVFAIGACTLYREVHAVAVRFAPSWEPLQERADTLWALYNSREDGPNADTRFRARFAATHSVAARSTERTVLACQLLPP